MTPANQLSRARRWSAVAVLTASLLVIMMDMTILNIALPEMAAELHPDSDQQLWIIDVYSLILAGLLVPLAAVADRWGRKRMLLLGYTIFGVASLLVLWAPTAGAVIAVRAFLGFGGAMIMPATLSLIRVIFTDPRERATALSIWAAVSGLGAATGPLLGGFLLEHFSWHAAFLVNVPLMLVALVAGIVILPESRVSHPGPLDLVAAALALGGMTLTVWSVKTFGKLATLADPAAWVAGLIGLALLAWFGARCARSTHPLIDLALFRSRVFSAGIIAALGSMFAMAAAMLLLAQWLQLVGGATPFEAGIQMLPIAITSALGSLAAPPLARLIGTRAVLAGGVATAGLGMLVLGVVPGGLNLVAVLLSLALIGIGMGSLAIGSAMIMSGSPLEKAGSAGALEETSYELGSVLGVAILGSVSALVYRTELAAGASLDGLTAELARQARESLGAAVAIGEHAASPELIASAGEAFTRSLQLTGIVGGLLMVAVAVLVFCVTPKGTDVSGAEEAEAASALPDTASRAV
ncbi:MFS transporter [Leucobacter sp. gxy201]|uniref:MFS transporter n=1 Tax=Leucobacter sp. gxy201 TaxID=2957200 RepID=UPI003DA1416E